MIDNIFFTCYYSLQKSEREADMILNTQTVIQGPMFNELSDGCDING